MEVKEAERVVIAKPVASRPGCSSFRSFSFSELLDGAVIASPFNNECSETAVKAIRPKTVRLKSAVNHHEPDLSNSGLAVCSPSDKVFKPDRKSDFVCKPVAKFVSRTTVSLLTNMESSNLFQEKELAQVETMQQPNLVKHQTDIRSELHQNFPSLAEKDKRSENLGEDQRSLSHTANGDRPFYDGYNWRKYGQKQVKGSEYPRSYYKCTYPNCPVKKKVERSLDGQIAEIVYNGEHNHPKPQPLRHNSSDAQWQGNVGNESNQPLWCNPQSDNESREGTTGNLNEFGLSARSSYSGSVPPLSGATVGGSNFGVTHLDNSSCHSGEFEEGTKRLEAGSDEPISKRRKNGDQFNESGTSTGGAQEPQLAVQNAIDSEILRDGFRWRKYGQKVVKGNQYPRSYYRCTNLKCNVRKYIERTSDEPNAFITTYEGKHNHDMPIKNTNSMAAKMSAKAVGR